MRKAPRGRTVFTLVGALVALQWSLTAQTPTSSTSSPAGVKRPLTYDVVDSWKSIQGTRLSDDGQWLAYATSAQGDDGELIVRNLRSGQEFKHARGTAPTFTPDGKFVVFTIAQPKAEEEKDAAAANAETPAAEPAQGQGRGGRGNGRAREPKTGLGIMTLADGEVKTFEKVGSFSLPENSSTWLAYHKGLGGGGAGGRGGRGGAGGRGGGAAGRGAAPAAAVPAPAAPTTATASASGQGGGTPAAPTAPREKRKDPGADLIIRNLVTGDEVTIPEVNEYEWNKNGDWIAYAVSSTDAAKDGAFARHIADGTVRTLHAGRGHYKSLAFDEAGTQLTFLSDEAEYAQKISPYRLYYWKAGDAAATELVSASTPGLAKGTVVSEFAAPSFSKDGARLYLGTGAPPAPTPDPDDKTPAPTKVDLWNYKDPLIQPMQKVREQQEVERSFRAVVHLADKRFVQLATQDLPTVNAGDDPTQLLGTSDMPYRQEISWDQTYNDVFLLDLKSGKPKKVLEHWGSNATSMSAAGKYLLYFDERNGHWFSYRVTDGARVNLTEKIASKFQQENNTPDLPGPYGAGGWTADDKSVLLYDKFDIWEVKPDGSGARMVTGGDGRKQDLVFRYRAIDPDERFVPTNKPLLLATVNDRTRATGFYRVAGLADTAPPEKVVMLDKAFGPVTKAKKADALVFTLSRFEEFPDLWVSDTSFKDMKKVSDANPQAASYLMGTSEIIEYVNADGRKLRALLTKPENFDPAKKYPLMVYIYEELTAGLHAYNAPNVGTSINIPRYVSNGYVVLRPDIVYETGYPGQSAEKCVIPAVNTVLAMGFIDPKRIGIQGHSWGGYQITYLVTRTNMFAAVEAGAAVSNMVSAYGGIRWGTGMSRAFQYEKTQSRIGAPPWDAPLQFIENSPIFWVKKVQTPYLTIHNDEDDAVPWYQGIEWFSAMRRLGKESYMFTFNGEKHGLRNRDNMKYWTVHMDEFFDHYLLGKPRPEWMDKGVSYTDRGKRDVAPLFKKKTPGSTVTQQEKH
jgi:dipeptidyl aminopeptidase/acylaminoacyl peptidase